MKEKILKKKTRWFYYFIVNIDDNIVLRKRDEKDIWQNLYEFVLYETESIMVPDKKTLAPIFKKLFGKTNLTIQSISAIYKQQLTHQTIVGQFITVKADKLNAALKDYELVKTGSLHNYPFPKIITSYLKEPVTPLQLF